MADKPLPQLRKPTTTAAAAFVEAEPSSAAQPRLEVVTENPRPKAKKDAAAPASKRRVSLYLSKATALKLQLQSVHQERDMSEIVEELLAKHLK